MQEDRTNNIPQSPETQPAEIRAQLGQENISKVGEPRNASDAGETPTSHFGAVEDDYNGHVEMTPVTPPMEGPYNLIGGDAAADQSKDVDPHDELNSAS